MKIYAFEGLRYTDRAGDASELAAPPFDQIDDALRDRLHGRAPHQFSHLTRPVPSSGLDGHHHAAALHRRWLEEGTVRAEAEPSLYPYAIELGDGGTRLGLTCLISVASGTEDDLRPHEETVDKPLADRSGLLHAMRVDLEPVLLLAEDENGAFETMLREDVGGSSLLLEHEDEPTGDRHLLYRFGSRPRIDAYRELLRPRFAAIADGHHRTKVAGMFARETGAAEGTAAATKLAVLGSLASPDLRIDPIHRAVIVELDTTALATLARERAPLVTESGAAIAAAVAAASSPAVGVWQRGGRPEIWHLEPEAAPGATASPAAVLLHRQMLRRAGLAPTADRDGSIVYRAAAEEVARMVRDGEASVGFWLPPMEPAEFAAVTARRELLPPKSTRFLPKLVSGLVWSAHNLPLG
jgi:uncharacterized protein (DUF1015 family)